MFAAKKTFTATHDSRRKWHCYDITCTSEESFRTDDERKISQYLCPKCGTACTLETNGPWTQREDVDDVEKYKITMAKLPVDTARLTMEATTAPKLINTFRSPYGVPVTGDLPIKYSSMVSVLNLFKATMGFRDSIHRTLNALARRIKAIPTTPVQPTFLERLMRTEPPPPLGDRELVSTVPIDNFTIHEQQVIARLDELTELGTGFDGLIEHIVHARDKVFPRFTEQERSRIDVASLHDTLIPPLIFATSLMEFVNGIQDKIAELPAGVKLWDRFGVETFREGKCTECPYAIEAEVATEFVVVVTPSTGNLSLKLEERINEQPGPLDCPDCLKKNKKKKTVTVTKTRTLRGNTALVSINRQHGNLQNTAFCKLAKTFEFNTSNGPMSVRMAGYTLETTRSGVITDSTYGTFIPSGDNGLIVYTPGGQAHRLYLEGKELERHQRESNQTAVMVALAIERSLSVKEEDDVLVGDLSEGEEIEVKAEAKVKEETKAEVKVEAVDATPDPLPSLKPKMKKPLIPVSFKENEGIVSVFEALAKFRSPEGPEGYEDKKKEGVFRNAAQVFADYGEVITEETTKKTFPKIGDTCKRTMREYLKDGWKAVTYFDKPDLGPKGKAKATRAANAAAKAEPKKKAANNKKAAKKDSDEDTNDEEEEEEF